MNNQSTFENSHKQGIFDSAYDHAAKVQAQYPFYLPTFEIMLRSADTMNRFSRVDSLLLDAKREMTRHYSKPVVYTLTRQRLDQWYREDQALNNLQKRFGGKKLRGEFESQYEVNYYQDIRNYKILAGLMNITCPAKTLAP